MSSINGETKSQQFYSLDLTSIEGKALLNDSLALCRTRSQIMNYITKIGNIIQSKISEKIKISNRIGSDEFKILSSSKFSIMIGTIVKTIPIGLIIFYVQLSIYTSAHRYNLDFNSISSDYWVYMLLFALVAITFCIVNKIDRSHMLHTKKLMLKLQNEVTCLDLEIRNSENKKNKLVKSLKNIEKKLRDPSISCIPEEYWNEPEKIIKYISSARARTMSDATNLYHQDIINQRKKEANEREAKEKNAQK
ncbi:hypothetical protein AGMMS49992_31810 [Clostridia bacterium]|nr:hypothetical protein AGMMS49992_31810 [Clostridia bacterium]